MPDSNVNVNPSVTGNNINDGTVNINNPNLSVQLSKIDLSQIAAAGSSAGGAALGVKVVQNMPGSPSVKLGAGLATMAGVQVTTAVMSKVLGNTNSNNGKSHFISGIINSDSDKLTNLYPDFPLNLLPEMDLLLNVILAFLFLIFNTFIVKNLTNINYSKYIPNNKMGTILNMVINRYINIWNKSSNFLIIYSWLMIFIFTIVLKICMFFIINQ